MNFQLLSFHLVEYPLLNVMINLCFFVMAVSLVLCLYRLIKGPSAADRIISADAISCSVMVLIVLYGIMQSTTLFMPAALVTALLGFIGMVALSKYLANGNIVYTMYQASEQRYRRSSK